MNKAITILLIDKTDVIKSSVDKEYSDITLEDLRPKSFQSFKEKDVVISINENGETNILKNRFGNKGIVVSVEDYNKFIKPQKMIFSKTSTGMTYSSEVIAHKRRRFFSFWPF